MMYFIHFSLSPNLFKQIMFWHQTQFHGHQKCFGSWQEIKDEVKVMLVESNREGLMMPRIKKSNRHNSIYKYPFPQCRCLQEAQNLTVNRENVCDVLDHQLKHII